MDSSDTLPGGSKLDNTPVVTVTAPVLDWGRGKTRNTAKQDMSAATRRTKRRRKTVQSQGYNLSYFKLWWNRMDKNKNKQSKKSKKMLNIKEKQDMNEHNRDRFPVCQILPCINEINLLVGGMVSKNHNMINEQTQAKQKQFDTMQVLDDTRDFVGLAPGTNTATTEVSLDQ